MARTILPELSSVSETLVVELRKVQPGEIVTYSQLIAAVGKDIRGEHRGYLQTARNILLREDSAVFSAVSGYGLKRLEDHEIPKIGVSAIRQINRKATRSLKQLSCVRNYNNLEKDEKVTFNATTSLLGMLRESSKSKKLQQIAGEVEKRDERMAARETLKSLL